MPHLRRARIAQTYSPGGSNVHPPSNTSFLGRISLSGKRHFDLFSRFSSAHRRIRQTHKWQNVRHLQQQAAFRWRGLIIITCRTLSQVSRSVVSICVSLCLAHDEPCKTTEPQVRRPGAWPGWLKLQDWTLTDDFAGVDTAGLDNERLDIDGLDNDGRIWAIDCNLLKITIERFYQLTGTYNSFESVLCLKTDEIHIDQQKLRTYNEYYLASCLPTLKCVK